MDIFLTSSMGGNKQRKGVKVPCSFDRRNHFVDKLKTSCGLTPRVMMICSMPDGHEVNDMYRELFEGAFIASGFQLQELVYVDDRNPEQLDRLMDFDLIILCGGHVPTQNAYFHSICLKQRLENWDGTIIGISAGTMNAAETVYAQPELEGEAADPSFVRYLPGLGLTGINVLPHFKDVRRLSVDGYNVERQLTIPDSHRRPIVALNDGSYIHITKNSVENHGVKPYDKYKATVYGASWLFDRGIKRRLCWQGRSRLLPFV